MRFNLASIIVEESRPLEKVVHVCVYCLDLITLLGFTKRVFIVSKPIFKKEVNCDICGAKKADYLIIPLDRGIYICEHCLNVLSAASKHRWNAWPKKPAKGEKCDLCGRPATFYIQPPKLLRKKD